jgi:hypothetical protein
MMTRRWVTEFEAFVDLEDTLATGKFTEYASTEAKEKADCDMKELENKSTKYDRKMARSFSYEYLTYGERYMRTRHITIVPYIDIKTSTGVTVLQRVDNGSIQS